MRLVHDILVGHVRVHAGNGTRPRGPVIAFIQHGTADTGWRYENVCPFCEKPVGYVNDPLNELTNMQLFAELQRQMSVHMDSIRNPCAASGWDIHVEVATKPLGTEKIVREM